MVAMVKAVELAEAVEVPEVAEELEGLEGVEEIVEEVELVAELGLEVILPQTGDRATSVINVEARVIGLQLVLGKVTSVSSFMYQ